MFSSFVIIIFLTSKKFAKTFYFTMLNTIRPTNSWIPSPYH